MNKRLTRKHRRRIRKLKQGLSAACVAILIFGGVFLYQKGSDYARQKQMKNRLVETYYAEQTADIAVETTEEPVLTVNKAPETDLTMEDMMTSAASSASDTNTLSLENTAEPTQAPAQEEILPEEPVLQPEFEALYEQNPDTIGWIKMAESVDYPLLWRDNTYYMKHDFDGNRSDAGAIFLDERNVNDMSDDHMLIYGHNMRVGSMFGDLDKYRTEDYLRQYPIITIKSAWESETRKYALISLFDASMNRGDRSYIKIIRTSFEQPEDKEAFISEMCERSFYDIDIEANADDQLVTLVTCSYTHNNGRFLLFARELREDETEEDILLAFQEMDLKN